MTEGFFSDGTPMFWDFDGQPVGMAEWSLLHGDPRRIVDQTDVGDVFVSTVWIGLDQAWGRAPVPLIYETMIFGGPDELDLTRELHPNRVSAQAGHDQAVAAVKAMHKTETREGE